MNDTISIYILWWCNQVYFDPLFLYVRVPFVVLENVSRLVLKSSSPLFIPNSPASLAYISFINPVSCALLWSLCLLWAMVIISLLCSHRFMRLACLLSSSQFFFPLDILTLPRSSPLCFCIHFQPLSLPY